MNTDELIRALGQDRSPRRCSLHVLLSLAFGLGFTVALIEYLWLLGPRADALTSLGSCRFCFKFVFSATIGGSAALACLRLAVPDGKLTRNSYICLGSGPALLVCAVLIELFMTPTVEWAAKTAGTGPLVCLCFIPLLSLPVLILILTAMRHGAPASPAQAGAFSGVAAAGTGAFLYGSYCPNDSPLFVGVWYSAAVLVLAVAGAVAGRYRLRW